MSTAIDVIILAAGLGTRMKSRQIKVLHPVCGKPMIFHLLDRLKPVARNRIIMVLGHQAERVKEAVSRVYPEVLFVRQERQLGTAHALSQARSLCKGANRTLLVLSGDTPFISEKTLTAFLEHHRKEKALLSVLSVQMDDPAGYGRIVRGKSGRLKKIVEEKDATRSEKKIREVNTGIYLIESSFAFPGLERIQSDNAQKEYYLTDLLEIGIRSRGKVVSFSGALKEEVAGINSRVDLARAEKELRNRIAEFWMREGVTLIDPERTYIEEEVTIGRDTVIYPGTLLSGKTRIGEECTIRSGVSVSNSDIGRGVLIRENCVISESRVGDGVTVGPFAHLRPGAVLMKESHIGNFVEIKKSEIGERSKVNHLSYIGDSVVGNRVNIGAGTITCNYDGSKKHRTVIGDDVFVGSDTQFVAPVRVGQGSLIGAGSTIVEDVPEESLSLSRERQVIKKGWVRKRKLINREQDG